MRALFWSIYAPHFYIQKHTPLHFRLSGAQMPSGHVGLLAVSETRSILLVVTAGKVAHNTSKTTNSENLKRTFSTAFEVIYICLCRSVSVLVQRAAQPIVLFTPLSIQQHPSFGEGRRRRRRRDVRHQTAGYYQENAASKCEGDACCLHFLKTIQVLHTSEVCV
jgi:hypothetical protein